MKITKIDILKNAIWLTLPPLLFGLSLMNYLPAVLTPALFNKGIPDILANGENIVRILVFAMPAFSLLDYRPKLKNKDWFCIWQG